MRAWCWIRAGVSYSKLSASRAGLGSTEKTPLKNLDLQNSMTRAEVGVVFFAGTGG